nr:tetratricopeptide repeat protein [Pseudomonas sp.]
AATIQAAAAPALAQAPDGQEPYGWPWLVRALDRLKPDTDTRLPETPTQVVNRLEAMIDQGQGAAALAEIRTLQEKRAASNVSGVDARLLFLEARALASQGEYSRAAEIYQGMTVSFPELPEPWNNLAVLYAAQGRLDEARRALETALLTDPGYAEAQANLGDIHLMLAARAHREAADMGAAGSTDRAQRANQLLK